MAAGFRRLLPLFCLSLASRIQWGECEPSESADLLFKFIYDERYAILNPPKINGTFNVTFDMAIAQLLDVDEKKQTVTLYVWKRMAWHDMRLAWKGRKFGNGTTFDGIGVLKIPNNQIWKPDLVLFNDVRETELDWSQFFSSVYSDGKVTLNVPQMLKMSCAINVEYFPYDQQQCQAAIGSWTMNGHELNLLNVSNSADLSSLESNNEFCVLKVPLKRNSVKYPCCDAPFIDITYTLVIQRKPLFYELNLVLPCVAILVVTLFGFRLPPESGERISLTVTILLALSVFLQLTGEHTPTQSDVVPLISRYFAATIALSSFCVLGSIGVLLLHFNGRRAKPMGRWTRFVFFGVLGRLALVRAPEEEKRVERSAGGRERYEKPHGVCNGQAAGESCVAESIVLRCPSALRTVTETVQSACGGRQPQPDLCPADEPPLVNELTNQMKRISRQLERIHQQLQSLAGTIAASGGEQLSVRQWETAAMILDRLLFCVFCLSSVIITSLLFTLKPDNYQPNNCPSYKA